MTADDKDKNKDNDRTRSLGDLDSNSDRPRIKKLGHFRIDSILGSGGMGTIYRAYDESMKRTVALKVLHASLGISERAQTRFVREAWIAGQLDHPNIVRVYSRGEEDDISFLAMELAEGGSLSDHIKTMSQSIPQGSDVTGSIDQEYISDILEEFIGLSRALDHIHGQGFIHRDIKPHNILLSGPEKTFKLTDFGLAHADDMTRMTRAGDFIGTVKYMSPELLAAHRAGIDKRTDIYSMGVTLYEALTLQLPFRADSQEKLIGEILAGHYIEARQTNRRIPVDLETVLMKASHHDPDRRYQTAAEFAEDLQRIIDGRPILAKRQSAFSKGIKYVKRNYKAVLGISAAVVIVIGTVLWSYYKVEQAYRIGADESTQFESSAGPTFTKIDVPALPEYCALSPDGERIAFTAEDGCLWVAPVRGRVDANVAGQPIKLTERMVDWQAPGLPVWSADGDWIAFNAKDTTDENEIHQFSMFVIPSTGGELRQVPAIHNGPGVWLYFRLSLSPDGKIIAFSSLDPLIPGESYRHSIYTMPVDGGSLKRVTDSLCREPAISPDGKMLAYIQSRLSRMEDGPKQTDVWVVPVEGGSPVRITNLPGRVMGPVWSPDSRMIAFTRLVRLHQGDLDAMAEGRELGIVALSDDYRPVGPPTIIELPLSSDDFIAGWSLSDQLGVVLKTSVRKAIYTVPASGGIATQVGPMGSGSPSWSPDGLTIFYADDTAVFHVPAEGGQASFIPIHGLQETRINLDVSPDGTRILLPGKIKGVSGTRFWVVSVDGGKPSQAATDTLSGFVSCWSPDGHWIVFVSGEGDLCLVPAAGGTIRQLLPHTDSSYVIGQMSWSPDGQRIAYPYRLKDSLVTISVIPFEGGDPVDLAEIQRDDYCYSVAWSPDGQRLAYPSFNETSGDIWVLPLDSGKPSRLQTGLDLEAIWHLDWSPDGEKIVFSAYWGAETSFWLIDNFLPLSQPAEPQPEPPSEPEKKEMTVRMVWSGDKVDGSGKVSPDGDFLPFIDWETGNLAVRQLASGETRYLTDDGGWDYPMRFADVPVVSPDGELIAYVWWAEADPSGKDSGTTSGDLCLINPDGTNRRVLVNASPGEELWPSSFSPDGAHIAVQLYDSAVNQQIVLVSTGDRSLQVLKVMGKHLTWADKTMCFSADGQYLIYDVTVEGAPANRDIFLLPVDGSGEVPLVQHPANDHLLGRVPGSNSVLFLSDRSGSLDAWVVEVVGGRPTDEPQLVRTNMGDISSMGFTSDSAFYYEVHTRWLTATTGRIDSVTGNIVTPLQELLAGSASGLTWSPDGEQVAFVAEQSAPAQPGGRRDVLYVRSVSSGQQRELSSQHYRVSNRVHWSPDSRYLLVRGVDAGDLYGSGPTPFSLSLVDVETGDETLLVQGISNASMGGVWSPDGESIYYIDRDSLVMRDLASGRQEVRYRGESRLHRWLALSPDGEQLLVGVRRDSCDCILVLSLSTGETRELYRHTKSDGIQVRSFEWMPDGRQVLFLLREKPNEGPTSLWRIPAEGGTAEKILHSRKLLAGLSVHPDGDQVSFTNVTLSSEVWVMENFLPEDTLER